MSKKQATADSEPDTVQATDAPNPQAEGLQIVQMNPADLNPAAYNPRRLTPEAKRQIKASIEKFGMVDPIIVNKNPERLNTVVGGHQRLRVLKDLGWPMVPCVFVNLSESDEKELNLRLNRNHGEWDYVMLRDLFDTSFLTELGFNSKEMGTVESEFEQKFNAVTNANAEMPIVQKFNETYGVVMIQFKSELDLNWLRRVLKIRREKCYKASRVGECFVLDVARLQEVWQESLEENGGGLADTDANPEQD